MSWRAIDHATARVDHELAALVQGGESRLPVLYDQAVAFLEKEEAFL